MNCARHLAVIALLLPAGAARAADFWLITNASTILEDEKLWVSLVRGETFPLSDGAAINSASSFVDRGPEKTITVDCQPELDGAFSVRRALHGAGVHVLGAEFSPAGSGSEAIQSAKAVVQVEPVEPADVSYAVPLGHSLEIIPRSNPCTWKVEHDAEIRVLLDGYPWPGVAVELWHEGEGQPEVNSRHMTDSNGDASFALRQAGHCSIRAHMDRTLEALGKSRTESLSATLSFRVLGTSDVSRMMLSVRNIHGEVDPAAVLGYRMGKRALQEMNLAGGSATIEATIWAPPASPMMAILDGVQAATSVSYGRENLRLEQTPSPRDAQAVFTDRSTNGRVICALRRDEALVHALMDATDAKTRRENALWLATLNDADLFDVTLMPPMPDSARSRATMTASAETH